jgi:hypothetical protein
MKSPPPKIESLEAKGQPLPQMPVYPSGLRGYTGRELFRPSPVHRRSRGGRSLPGILLKRGLFWGSPGASPGLDLIILQHRKCCIFRNVISRG